MKKQIKQRVHRDHGLHLFGSLGQEHQGSFAHFTSIQTKSCGNIEAIPLNFNFLNSIFPVKTCGLEEKNIHTNELNVFNFIWPEN
jgi:hypothetical protein